MPELRVIPIALIKVPEIRVSSILDPEQKALIASTIQTVGVIQDPVVRVLEDGTYELVSGLSRIRELQNLGKTEITVKLIGADEKTGLIMNVTENVARGSFEYISISRAIRRLRELGSSDEELTKVFPWKKSWIAFLEGLQDLPEDIIEGIRTKKLTPTHVQEALKLPTPHEVHSGLKTAMDLAWDTTTFKTFITNRVEQIQRARMEAASKGVAPTIPDANPTELITYGQCLLCGYTVPRQTLTAQICCEGCRDLARYVTSQLGDPKTAINAVYQALQALYGPRNTQEGTSGPTLKGPSQG